MSRNLFALPLASLALLAGCSGGDKGFVVYNTPPAVTISEPLEGAVFEAGEPVYFAGQVVDDADVTALTVEWASSLNGVLPDPDPPSSDGLVEFVSTALDPGTHVITLRATDNSNEQGEAQVTIQVGEQAVVDEDPTIEIISPGPGITGIDGEPFTFAVGVDDGQDAPAGLVVELEANTVGFICFMVPDASGNALCEDTLPLGQHLLTFRVEDSDGNTATANAVFDVVDRDDADLDLDGHTPNGGDCNDSAPTIYPGATEICDGLDNDCNPATEIDVNSPCYDDDGDGFCEAPPCTNATETVPDCDDSSALIFPGGTEVQNLEDDDCDGQVDEGFGNYDDDGDGFCETPPCVNASGTQQDCDDTDGATNPNAPEVCGDGADNNCNGLTNEQNAIGCSIYFQDSDGDGYGTAAGNACYCEPQYPYTGTTSTDCDDSSANVNPGQTGWFSSPNGQGNYDYNCDGQQELRYPGTGGSCNPAFFSCNGNDGWVGSQPACGGNGTYIDECDFDLGGLLGTCAISCAVPFIGPCFNAPGGMDCWTCLGQQCTNGVCETGTAVSVQECR